MKLSGKLNKNADNYLTEGETQRAEWPTALLMFSLSLDYDMYSITNRDPCAQQVE